MGQNTHSQLPALSLRNTKNLYRQLHQHHQLDNFWPDGDWPLRGGFEPSHFEVAVGAVLTQNTRWQNVETCLDRLQTAGLTSPERILAADLDTLGRVIRPSGFYRNKAKTIRALAAVYPPDDTTILSRKDLLDLSGIGPETADSIRLYAFEQAEFVVDAYTRRLLDRLGWLKQGESYDQVKTLIEAQVSPEVELYKRFHALIVQHCKDVCRKNPNCKQCFLRQECPRGHL